MSGSTWRVEPVGPLRGDVKVRGSKNAVTKHMVAALLSDSPTVITNAPENHDVEITVQMLRALGVVVRVEGDSIRIEPPVIGGSQVPLEFTGLNRIPILLVGPLLHRVGEAFVPMVGGDRIGARPVDFHVDALRQLGAEVEQTPDGLEAKAVNLRGARIRLPFPSVMATETILLTAVLADGRTIIENAAIEPEVIELALFLQRMGARLELRPDRRFLIEGVESLKGAEQRLNGDRIEAFSYLVAGLVTGGEVRVHGCPQGRLITAIATLQGMGARFEITDDWLLAKAEGPLRTAVVDTDTHPGFMTDWQSPLVVLFTQADGMSVLHETVFEDRFAYVDALRAMGAEAELYDACLGSRPCRFRETTALHSIVVRGQTRLRGADITVPDVRGGFAYLIAAAAADGASTLRDVHHLERGYHQPLKAFADLGLHIERVG